MRWLLKRWWFWLLLAVLAILSVLISTAWRQYREDRAKYDQIQMGMTEADVQAILSTGELFRQYKPYDFDPPGNWKAWRLPSGCEVNVHFSPKGIAIKKFIMDPWQIHL